MVAYHYTCLSHCFSPKNHPIGSQVDLRKKNYTPPKLHQNFLHFYEFFHSVQYEKSYKSRNFCHQIIFHMPDFVSTTKKSILQVQKVVNISVWWSKFRIFLAEFWLSSFLVVSHIDPGCSGSSIWTWQKVSENFPFAFTKTAQKT